MTDPGTGNRTGVGLQTVTELPQACLSFGLSGQDCRRLHDYIHTDSGVVSSTAFSYFSSNIHAWIDSIASPFCDPQSAPAEKKSTLRKRFQSENNK